MKLSRMIVPKGVLVAMLAFPGLVLPAFAQQEVDPTWYDPWAAAPKAAAHPVEARTEQKKTARKLRMASAPKEKQPTPVRGNAPHRTQQAVLQLALK
jgi:hypothetical protein